MAKLNYKTATPISPVIDGIEKKIEKGYSITSEASEKNDDIDLSFTSTESFFEKTDNDSELELEPFMVEAEKPKRAEKPAEFKPKRKFHYEDEGFQFDSFTAKLADYKNYLLIGAASIVLLVVLFYLYQFLKGDSEVADMQEPTSAPAVIEQPQVPDIQTGNLALAPIYDKNLSGNNVIRNNLQNLFSRKPDMGDYSLLVLTPFDLNITILTNSRNRIPNFSSALKSACPNFDFNLVSTHSRSAGSKEMFYADIVGIQKSIETPGPKISQVRSVNQKDFVNLFQNLVQKHNIKLDNFTTGKTTNKSTYLEQLYYANLSGQINNINSFIAEFVKTYPMVQLMKLSLYPHDLEVISNSNILARINFTFYSDK